MSHTEKHATHLSQETDPEDLLPKLIVCMHVLTHAFSNFTPAFIAVT